jgi:regulator of sigma E protease
MSELGIIIGIIGLGLLAAAHEIGHFVVAKRLGIKVEELSIFVGPSLFSWTRKGVVYHIRLIPFGAYVRFPGMEDEDGGVSNPDSYFNQARWKRLLVALGGPVTNFLLGIIILSVVFSSTGFFTLKIDTVFPGTQLAETNAMKGDVIQAINGHSVITYIDMDYLLNNIPNTDPIQLTLRSPSSGQSYDIELQPVITSQYFLGITRMNELDEYGGWAIVEVNPAQNDGNPVFKIGDSLLSVNGVGITDPGFVELIASSGGEELSAHIVRDGKQMDIALKAIFLDTVNDRGVNTQFAEGILPAIKHSTLFSVSLIKMSAFILRDIVTGRVAPQDTLTGPVGIASIISNVVTEPSTDKGEKIDELVIMAGIISVALAFSNLLPLPGLDGNAMVLLTVEMIRGKKISLKTEQVINVIGFVFLIALTIYVLTIDIMRLVG